jgi:Type IV secretion system pilin
MMHLHTVIFSISDVSPYGLPQATADASKVQTILQIVFGIVGALAFLMIVVSGLRYVLSAGNPDRTSRAKDGIVYALVGMTIAISAEAIVTFVVNRI